MTFSQKNILIRRYLNYKIKKQIKASLVIVIIIGGFNDISLIWYFFNFLEFINIYFKIGNNMKVLSFFKTSLCFF